MQQRLSGVDLEFSLAWLLHPVSVETFLTDIWAKTHHHVARHRAGYFDGPRFYSKDSEPQVFSGEATEHRPTSEAIREAAQRFAEPGYRALASHSG